MARDQKSLATPALYISISLFLSILYVTFLLPFSILLYFCLFLSVFFTLFHFLLRFEAILHKYLTEIMREERISATVITSWKWSKSLSLPLHCNVESVRILFSAFMFLQTFCLLLCDMKVITSFLNEVNWKFVCWYTNIRCGQR